MNLMHVFTCTDARLVQLLNALFPFFPWSVICLVKKNSAAPMSKLYWGDIGNLEFQ